MNRWCGVIGFAEESKETAPSVYEEGIVERRYYGNIIKNNRKLESSGGVNDNISVSNQISVIADPYAQNHFYSIRYVTFCGTKWKVSNVDVDYHRLILTLGGVWNGQTSGS